MGLVKTGERHSRVGRLKIGRNQIFRRVIGTFIHGGVESNGVLRVDLAHEFHRQRVVLPRYEGGITRHDDREPVGRKADYKVVNGQTGSIGVVDHLILMQDIPMRFSKINPKTWKCLPTLLFH